MAHLSRVPGSPTFRLASLRKTGLQSQQGRASIHIDACAETSSSPREPHTQLPRPYQTAALEHVRGTGAHGRRLGGAMGRPSSGVLPNQAVSVFGGEKSVRRWRRQSTACRTRIDRIERHKPSRIANLKKNLNDVNRGPDRQSGLLAPAPDRVLVGRHACDPLSLGPFHGSLAWRRPFSQKKLFSAWATESDWKYGRSSLARMFLRSISPHAWSRSFHDCRWLSEAGG